MDKHLIVKKYIKEHSLIESNILSFNDFIDNRIQQIVTDLSDGRFPGYWRELPFTMPTELMKGVDRTADTGELHIEEERRLLYVSMTRAKKELYLLHSEARDKNIAQTEINGRSEFIGAIPTDFVQFS